MTTNNALAQVLLNSFEQHKPQLRGKRVWLACSGGRDSLSLAHLCQQLFNADKLPFLPQLLHINHGMQQANTAWAQQVSSWAQQNQMPCQVLKINLIKKTEQEARQARYQAMINVMNHQDVLILGHHQDDQVETLLMRLFNGAGVNGLSGMKEWSIKSSQNQEGAQKNIVLWRPLLSVSRQQITQYVDKEGLSYIDDPTNVALHKSSSDLNPDQLNDRAWLRSVLLPHITQRYPKAKQAIARTGQLMHEASVILNEQCSLDLSQSTISDRAFCSVLDINQLTRLSTARQSALIHSWLAPTAAELPPSRRLVEDVLSLMHRQDSNHQTCLYWDSGRYQYQIRSYQHKLYRLWHSWEQWLQVAPTTQQVSLDIDKGIASPLWLKPTSTGFEWHLQGLNLLIAELKRQLAADIEAKAETQTEVDSNENKSITASKGATLIFQPLPRSQKIALPGRVGRKSGKKLLQALDVPSFMRQSVVLCSLQLSSAPAQQQSIPLLVITPEQTLVLQSPFLQSIAQLVENRKLISKIHNL
ncbi:tRNA lysidine(34) synthetase TilS [Psychrobacter phenylpyruvicus]|uniref:tRNA(Ile)-lysidine synthase n=1 Tax=Psychrobacter phenylpyruvicus TaxID=29432 RepID=A0A379LPG4_9GAMM|nr:tRNA lysidine(34) synthetase TilS [Psychrobacter phenylpyruvicus]SUD91692.1 tRNA(Ile)-lysidine synthase [Psychrobacter phenylpyruvicus]